MQVNIYFDDGREDTGTQWASVGAIPRIGERFYHPDEEVHWWRVKDVTWNYIRASNVPLLATEILLEHESINESSKSVYVCSRSELESWPGALIIAANDIEEATKIYCQYENVDEGPAEIEKIENLEYHGQSEVIYNDLPR